MIVFGKQGLDFILHGFKSINILQLWMQEKI